MAAGRRAQVSQLPYRCRQCGKDRVRTKDTLCPKCGVKAVRAIFKK